MKKYKTPNGQIVEESVLRQKYGDKFDGLVANGTFSVHEETAPVKNSKNVYETPNGKLVNEGVLVEKYGDQFSELVSNGTLKKKEGATDIGNGLKPSVVEAPSTSNLNDPFSFKSRGLTGQVLANSKNIAGWVPAQEPVKTVGSKPQPENKLFALPAGVTYSPDMLDSQEKEEYVQRLNSVPIPQQHQQVNNEIVKDIVASRSNDAVMRERAKQFLVKDAEKEGLTVNADNFPKVEEYFNQKKTAAQIELDNLSSQVEDLGLRYGDNVMLNPEAQQKYQRINELYTYLNEIKKYSNVFIREQAAKEIKPDDFSNYSDYLKAVGRKVNAVNDYEGVKKKEDAILTGKDDTRSPAIKDIENYNFELSGIETLQSNIINDLNAQKIDEPTARAEMAKLQLSNQTLEKRYPEAAIDNIRKYIGDYIAQKRKAEDGNLKQTWHNVVSAAPSSDEVIQAIHELRANEGVDISEDQEKAVASQPDKIPLTSMLGHIYKNTILKGAETLNNIVGADNTERALEFRDPALYQSVQQGEIATPLQVRDSVPPTELTGQNVVRMEPNPDAGKHADILSWATANNVSDVAGTIMSYIGLNKAFGYLAGKALGGLAGAETTGMAVNAAGELKPITALTAGQTNLASNILSSTYLNYYDKLEASKELTDDPTAQKAYALTSSILTGLVFAEINPGKILSGVTSAEEKNIGQKFMDKLAEGKGTLQPEKMKSLFADWAVSTAKDLGHNMTLVKANQIADIALDKLTNKDSLKGRNVSDELFGSLPADIISFLPFSGIAGYKAATSNVGVRNAIRMAITDPVRFESDMANNVESGKISPEDAANKISYINGLAKTFRSGDMNTEKLLSLTPEKRFEYADNLLRENAINSKIKDMTDDLQIAQEKEKITTLQERRKEILNEKQSPITTEPVRSAEGQTAQPETTATIDTQAEADKNAKSETAKTLAAVDKVQPNEITVGEMIDKVGSYKGERGQFSQDGQTVIFKVEGKNKEYELGNVEEIKNSPISSFDIASEQSVVNVNDAGNIEVRGNEYINHFSDPLAAINFDKNGNVISVNLETADGKKRTFRGNVAEDVAYQIHLKEITKDNETTTRFEDFINTPDVAKVITEGLPKNTEAATVENNGKVQPADRIKIEAVKPEDNVKNLLAEVKDNPALIGMNEAEQLKFIAEQAQNVSPTGEKLEGDAYLSTVDKFGDKLVQAAIEAHPEETLLKTKPAEDTTPTSDEKSDIEKRRQNALKSIVEEDGEFVSNDNPAGAVRFFSKESATRNINAKYDAELSTLESKDTTPTVSGEDFTAKGGNKVVDEKGEPLTLYHSTFKDFDNFNEGVNYFAEDKDYSKQIATTVDAGRSEGKGLKTIPVHIKASRVFELPKGKEMNGNVVKAYLKDPEFVKKYDAIKGIDLYSDNKVVYAVLDKSNIRKVEQSENKPNTQKEEVKSISSTKNKDNEIPEKNSGEGKQANAEHGQGSKSDQEKEVLKKAASDKGAATSKEPPPPKEEDTATLTVDEAGTLLSHAGMQKVADDFGLADVQSKDPETDIKIAEDAAAKAKEWNDAGTYAENVDKLIKNIEDGHGSNPVEKIILQQHIANVRAEAEGIKDIFSKEYDQKINELDRLKKAGAKLKSTAGATLRDTTIFSDADPTMADWMAERKESLEVDDLTNAQKEEVQKTWDEYDAKLKVADEKVTQAEEQIAQLKAELATKTQRQKRTYLRSKNVEALKKERENIVKSIQDKLKKARGETNIAIVPYAKELIAIAPDVSKLVTNLIDTGVTKLADIVDNIHGTLVDAIPGITKRDVHDIIAGEYNENKPTLTALQYAKKDVIEEAKLINKLEALQNGEFPKSERVLRERNKEITDLRNKIKEYRKYDQSAKTPEQILNSIKKRNEARLKEINDKIVNKDFSTKAKPVPVDENKLLKQANPELWKQTMDAINEKEEAGHQFEILKKKDELAKRKGLQKYVVDPVSKFITTAKSIKANFDDSATMVQLLMAVYSNPRSGLKAKIEAFKDINNTRFKRQLAALHNSIYWDTIQQSGLDITEPQSFGKKEVEELFSGNLLDNKFKVPFTGKKVNPWTYTGGIFERIFTSMGNNLRLNLFYKRIAMLENQGKTFDSHPEEYKGAARAINELTGRGKVADKLQTSMEALSPIIWAPKMLASTFNTLGITDVVAAFRGKKGVYREIPPQQARYLGFQMAKGIGMGVSVMAALALRGWGIDKDPRSGTFGNVTSPDGNTKYNVFGRYGSLVKNIVQLVGGTKTGSTGKEVDIDKSLGGRGKALWTFVRGKMTPATGLFADYWLNDKTNLFTKQPINLSSLPSDLFAPMTLSALSNGLHNDGTMSLLTRFLPEVEGIQVTDQRDFKTISTSLSDKSNKFLKDHGIDVPYFNPKQIEIKQKKNGEAKIVKLSDLDEETQVKYEKTHSQIFDQELGRLKSSFVFKNEYGNISLNSTGKNDKKIWVNKLDDKDMKKFISIVTGKATEKTKETLFKEYKKQ